MNTYLPMALAVEFKDFTITEIVVYSSAALFFILFAVYYNKKTKGVNLAMERRRNEYVNLHSDLSPYYREAILGGKLISGMNEDEVVACLGNPNRTKILSVEPARSEVWIYRNGIYAHMHMGILQKWKIHLKFISFS